MMGGLDAIFEVISGYFNALVGYSAGRNIDIGTESLSVAPTVVCGATRGY
jgi:hypothetical protein